MTKKLEELFGFPPSETDEQSEAESNEMTIEETREAIASVENELEKIDKIEAALPAVTGLEHSDKEFDELREKALEGHENLMDLGFNVDSRFSSEIFNAAGSMLGHALSATIAKQQKKLKVIELQMKKLKLDSDLAKKLATSDQSEPAETAQGFVLTRNELLDKILGDRNKSNEKE